MDGLSRLNDRPAAEVRAELLRCCGSSLWADALIAHRPFPDAASFYAAAESVWWDLEPADWREAFAHHPRIGDLHALRERFASTAEWASRRAGGCLARARGAARRPGRGEPGL